MKASEAPFTKLLSTKAQFTIPIYQRTYSWTHAQCRQLWDDIISTSHDDHSSGHFIGSIVYVEESGPGPASAINRLHVIDGQQRLTTLTLLLVALRDRLAKKGDQLGVRLRQIEDYYLFNSAEDGLERYKLVLTQSDQATLFALLDSAPLPEQHSKRMVENFRLFTDLLKKESDRLGEVFAGINKLSIVDVALDPRYDHPQRIFESLNSTGLALTQADLIRNFVLMGLPHDEQSRLYTHHWRRMEERFGQTQYAEHFDAFMRHYLTVKTGAIPRISEVYAAFKNYATKSDRTIAEIVEDIHRFAEYFVCFALEREPDTEIRAAFHDINTLRVDVTYPFLLEVYRDYSEALLSRGGLLSIVRLIESYIVRRAICGIATNSLNTTFQTLYRSVDVTQYVDSVQAAFQMMAGVRRSPNDAEFLQEFAARDIYNLTNRRNYLLRKLENYDSKEHVNVEAFTIEHILPQSSPLSPEWQSMLGPDWQQIQERYVHTIGNLTLTGYNPEMSNRPFGEKRDMPNGFRDSPVRLNQDLRHLETWGETEIVERGRRLAHRAVHIWTHPRLPESELERFRAARRDDSDRSSAGASLADHPQLEGDVRTLWETLRQRILNLE